MARTCTDNEAPHFLQTPLVIAATRYSPNTQVTLFATVTV